MGFRIFGNLWWPFRRSEKAPPEIEKTGRASALPFSGPSRAGIVFDAGKSKVKEVPCLRTPRIRLEYARSSRHCVALDSLYWMRHPHPLISLLSLMLLCSIRATSHEQPLNTISLSAPEDRCGLLQLPLTAYFHNLEVVTSRSSPTHDLERRLARFLRLHRATLC